MDPLSAGPGGRRSPDEPEDTTRLELFEDRFGRDSPPSGFVRGRGFGRHRPTVIHRLRIEFVFGVEFELADPSRDAPLGGVRDGHWMGNAAK